MIIVVLPIKNRMTRCFTVKLLEKGVILKNLHLYMLHDIINTQMVDQARAARRTHGTYRMASDGFADFWGTLKGFSVLAMFT
jgi:hypothetical protein